MGKRKLRSVDIRFWDDAYIESLDPVEKLLFLYLLTNQNNNLSGIYEITLRKIAYQTGIDKDMVSKILLRFQKDKKAYFFDNYIILANFFKHQNYNKTTMKKNIFELVDDLPENIIEYLVKLGNKHIKSLFEFAGIPYTYPIHTPTIPYGEEEGEVEDEVQGEGEKKSKEIDNNISLKEITNNIIKDNIKTNNKDRAQLNSIIQNLWITTFGRNPKLPEVDVTEKILKRFGEEKTKRIFYDAILKNFKSVGTLLESLDADGNITPRGENGKKKKIKIGGIK